MEEIDLERVRGALSRVLRDVAEVAAAYAYGSRVGGRALPLSDLDLAFVLAAGAARDDALFAERLAARLASELGTAAEIDAHVAEDLPLPVRGRIVTQGVLVYERDPARRVEFETSTRRLYFDFLPFLDRDAHEGIRARG
ncbi:MAG: nucleotidyltransferase domain-containing protein [Gemmatimonadetes bacterium]|nr:nucleotidyltransferase domain-containing protein [Gemmatimonadota bacterium]